MKPIFVIINFVILAAGLYFFGRKPVKKLFGGRKAAIEKGLRESAGGREAAAVGAEIMEELHQEGERRKNAAREESAQRRRVILDEIRSETAEAVERMEQEAEREKSGLRMQMLESARNDTLHAAMEKVRATLMEEPYSSRFIRLESVVADQILQQAGISAGNMVYLYRNSALYVTLTSTFPLAPGEEDRIREAVEKMIPHELGSISWHYTVDPALVGGVTLRIGDMVYDGSVDSMLRNLEKKLEKAPVAPEPDADAIADSICEGIRAIPNKIDIYQQGRVLSVSDGICWMDGLADSMYGELVEFENGERGMVLSVEPKRIGAVIFGPYQQIQELSHVRRLGWMADVPVGKGLLGRVVDSLGRPLDGRGAIENEGFRAVESPAPAILERQSVSVPLETGIKAVDALVPIGRGQRELIIGDRQTGKTSLALDTILNQRGKNVICIYVAIGQKETSVARVVNMLQKNGAMDYTVVVCADASRSAPLRYLAPYAGAAMGEHFMRQGKDVLIVYDDLSKHADAYREISLLLHRPAGREAYPGDVFYLHSRLLERSARLSKEAGGGSMTALPIVETQAGDISAYIPTNVISITDGQIYLESDQFREGQRPAVNVGLSVSRVGGAAQLKSMRQVAGKLRMELAQYRELAAFAQFGADLDDSTQRTLARGARMTMALRQPLYQPLTTAEQVLVIYAVSNGFADDVEPRDIPAFEHGLRTYFFTHQPEILEEIASGSKMSPDLIKRMETAIRDCKGSWDI